MSQFYVDLDEPHHVPISQYNKSKLKNAERKRLQKDKIRADAKKPSKFFNSYICL